MSSFFTLPASQKKRKRDDAGAAQATKKRGPAPRDTKGTAAAPLHKKKPTKDADASDSESDEDIESDVVSSAEEESGSESEDETAADRRLRLAERYLDNVKEEVEDHGFDAAEIDRDLIAERLKEDVDEFKGRVFRQIADQLSFSTPAHSFFRADTHSTTSVAVHSPYVYTVSKDKTLIKWELATPTDASESPDPANTKSKRPERRKPRKIKFTRGLQLTEGGEKHGHTGSILSVAVSPSGQFVATGGSDKRIIIWDAESLVPLKTFSQHRDAVSSLAFTRSIPSMSSGEQLFSASFDRTIKTWSLSPGAHAYVETLFGHQDHVVSVDSMAIDQCVSVGARDRTARLWKVVDETQLIFRGGAHKNVSTAEGSIDCVAVVPPTHFVTGSDNGAIALWSIHKKKPLYTIAEAHGLDDLPPPEDLSGEKDPSVAERVTRALKPSARWITALTTLPGTDVVLSGSWDGHIRAWQISEDKRSLIPLGPISPDANTPFIKGVVNDIAVFERRDQDAARFLLPPNKKSANPPQSKNERKGLCIVAAVGKECRLGRWKSFGSKRLESEFAGRNGAVVIEVPFMSNRGSDSTSSGKA
ncbi:pre-rRNA processing protein [Ascosphaera pollenicola]|nr:pre-rRNA processing protein [Ascosphaera pollenicola]